MSEQSTFDPDRHLEIAIKALDAVQSLLDHFADSDAAPLSKVDAQAALLVLGAAQSHTAVANTVILRQIAIDLQRLQQQRAVAGILRA